MNNTLTKTSLNTSFTNVNFRNTNFTNINFTEMTQKSTNSTRDYSTTNFSNNFSQNLLMTTLQTISTTNSSVEREDYLKWVDYILIFIFIVILIIGVFGNLLVCYFFKTSYKELQGMALLLFYLACVDLLSSILNPALFLYWQFTFHKEWDFGMIGCKMIPTSAKCLVTSSLGIIWLITIERCIVISRPYTVHLKNKHINTVFILILLFAVLCETPWVIHNKIPTDSTCNVPDLRLDSFFYPAVIVIIVRDLIFMTTFAITTIVIYRILYDKSSMKTLKEQKQLNKNKKIMRLIILLAIVFIVLVFPRELLHLVYMMSWKVGEGFPYTHTLRNINSFLKILHMCNSIANIFIYAGLMGRFRKKLYGLLSVMIGRKFVSKTIKATTIFSDDSAINSTEKSSFTYTVKSKQ